MEDKISKIARILELSSTETRENAVCSYIENVIFCFDNQPLTISDIMELIFELFEIRPIENEALNGIDSLIKSNHLEENGNKFKLTDDRYKEIRRVEILAEESIKQRQKRFSLLISELGEVNSTELDLLWKCFNEYLYDCFYQYGEYALNNFIQINNDENKLKLVNGNPYYNAISKIKDTSTKVIFQKLVIHFAQKLSTEDLDYLESLANKTMTFYSLGLPKELHQEVLNSQIDWTILVDTNFLYSVLDLHKNVENEASIQLLKTVQKLNLNVKFKYIPATISELKRKKNEFQDSIPQGTYTKPQISALLNSGRLDAFAEIYYENLLKNSDSLHPSQIIDTAERVINNAFNITIYNSKFEQITDEQINNGIIEFERYIQIKNEVRREKTGFEPIYKHPKQIWHDILLREAIEWLRSQEGDDEVQTFAGLKFLGVTLDKLLISFDKNQLLRDKRRTISNFYTPSFLLERIHKFAPLETDDYKRAFIAAISSFNFYDKSVKRSKDAQKFVNYYRSKGLNDEKLLLSFLTDDLFLDNFFKEDINEDIFFETEISKRITALQFESESKSKVIENLKQKNSQVNNEVKITVKQLSEKELELKQLEDSLQEAKTQIEKRNIEVSQKSTLETQVSNYQEEISLLKERLNQKDKNEKYKDECEKYEKRKKIFIDEEWSKKENDKWGLKWVFAAWILTFLVSYFLFFKIDEKSPYKVLRPLFPVLTFIVSNLFAVFHNKDLAVFSLKYWISRKSIEEKYKKEFEQVFEKDNIKPVH
jgi:hypothetical protein